MNYDRSYRGDHILHVSTSLTLTKPFCCGRVDTYENHPSIHSLQQHFVGYIFTCNITSIALYIQLQFFYRLIRLQLSLVYRFWSLNCDQLCDFVGVLNAVSIFILILNFGCFHVDYCPNVSPLWIDWFCHKPPCQKRNPWSLKTFSADNQ